MSRTDWSQIVYDKQLATAKSSHKKLFITQKILATDLPRYIDEGWEKCKDYKSPKYVGVAKEKPSIEQFEDKIWLTFIFCSLRRAAQMSRPIFFCRTFY